MRFSARFLFIFIKFFVLHPLSLSLFLLLLLHHLSVIAYFVFVVHIFFFWNCENFLNMANARPTSTKKDINTVIPLMNHLFFSNFLPIRIILLLFVLKKNTNDQQINTTDPIENPLISSVCVLLTIIRFWKAIHKKMIPYDHKHKLLASLTIMSTHNII